MNEANRDPAGRRRNHLLIRRVSFFFKFDSKESQPIANPGADHGPLLSDAASEHQRVQSPQRRRECADPFLDLVAKQRDRPAARTSCVSRSSKSRMSELVSDTPSSPDWKLTISLNCCALIFSVRARYQTSPGSDRRTGAHRHPAGRGETDAGVHRFAVTHRRQTRAVAKVCEDDPT